MKLRMFFLMLALGVCGAAMESCDDDDDNLNVPEKLQSAFSQKYPEASPKWKTRSNYYIADFHGRNYESEAWFTSGAVWLMTETDLPYAALPEAVKNAFQNSEYGAWRPDDVDMIEREGMEPVYVLEVEQGPREMDLYYNAEGILIRAVEDSEDDSENYLPVELPEGGVKNFLQEKYAASKIVETDREHGQLEVDIIHDGVAKEVLFDNNGNWLSTSWEISTDTLPEAVKTAIRQEINDNYVGYEADDELEQVETPDGNYYRIELEAEDDRAVNLKIREDGTLLK
ncbi:PepSY-like domain-containing protein [Alistipes onderdonkii]|uniref:PepSY-like domain-containing protein n=1 Tax=Alistipes onderdonkii TaxID=328813 RepID=UPI0036F1BB05